MALRRSVHALAEAGLLRLASAAVAVAAVAAVVAGGPGGGGPGGAVAHRSSKYNFRETPPQVKRCKLQVWLRQPEVA